MTRLILSGEREQEQSHHIEPLSPSRYRTANLTPAKHLGKLLSLSVAQMPTRHEPSFSARAKLQPSSAKIETATTSVSNSSISSIMGKRSESSRCPSSYRSNSNRRRPPSASTSDHSTISRSSSTSSTSKPSKPSPVTSTTSYPFRSLSLSCRTFSDSPNLIGHPYDQPQLSQHLWQPPHQSQEPLDAQQLWQLKWPPYPAQQRLSWQPERAQKSRQSRRRQDSQLPHDFQPLWRQQREHAEAPQRSQDLQQLWQLQQAHYAHQPHHKERKEIHHYTLCRHTHPPSTRPLNTQPTLNSTTSLSEIQGRCYDCDLSHRRKLESRILDFYIANLDKLTRRLRLFEKYAGDRERAEDLCTLAEQLEGRREEEVKEVWMGFERRWGIGLIAVIRARGRRYWETKEAEAEAEAETQTETEDGRMDLRWIRPDKPDRPLPLP